MRKLKKLATTETDPLTVKNKRRDEKGGVIAGLLVGATVTSVTLAAALPAIEFVDKVMNRDPLEDIRDCPASYSGRLLIKATMDPTSSDYQLATDPKQTAIFMGARSGSDIKDEEIAAGIRDLATQADFNEEETQGLVEEAVKAKDVAANAVQRGSYVTFLCRNGDNFTFNETGELLLELNDQNVSALRTLPAVSHPTTTTTAANANTSPVPPVVPTIPPLPSI